MRALGRSTLGSSSATSPSAASSTPSIVTSDNGWEAMYEPPPDYSSPSASLALKPSALAMTTAGAYAGSSKSATSATSPTSATSVASSKPLRLNPAQASAGISAVRPLSTAGSAHSSGQRPLSSTGSMSPGHRPPSSAGSSASGPPVPSKPRHLTTPDTGKKYVIALYDFEAANEGDLTIRANDRIELINRTPDTNDWWTGRLNNQVGIFPGEFLDEFLRTHS